MAGAARPSLAAAPPSDNVPPPSAGAGRPPTEAARPVVGGDRGSATVEAAIAVSAVVVVLALVLAGTAAAVAQIQTVDAAREAARLVARGDRDRAEQAARRIAPSGADISISVRGDEVVVEVGARPGGLLPGLTVRSEAMAILEPGVAGGGE